MAPVNFEVIDHVTKGRVCIEVSTDYNHHGGYMFDLTDDGEFDSDHYFDPQYDAALHNFAKCLFPIGYDSEGRALTVDGETIFNVSRYKDRDTKWQERIVTCKCGEKVEVSYDRGHGIDCKCGRIYSYSGSLLAPRSQWEERWDDDSTQPYFAEFGYMDE